MRTEGYKYRLFLNGKSEIKLNFMFKPKEIKDEEFNLEFNVLAEGSLPIIKCIKYVSRRPLIQASESVIDFGRCMGDGIKETRHLLLKNNTDDIIKFKIKPKLENGLNDSIFNIRPEEGIIEDTKDIKIEFRPIEEGRFINKYEIMAIGEDSEELKKGNPELMLRGIGQRPRLTFDKKEIIMRPVIKIKH